MGASPSVKDLEDTCGCKGSMWMLETRKGWGMKENFMGHREWSSFNHSIHSFSMWHNQKSTTHVSINKLITKSKWHDKAGLRESKMHCTGERPQSLQIGLLPNKVDEGQWGVSTKSCDILSVLPEVPYSKREGSLILL
jgi:hypothetical protein